MQEETTERRRVTVLSILRNPGGYDLSKIWWGELIDPLSFSLFL